MFYDFEASFNHSELSGSGNPQEGPLEGMAYFHAMLAEEKSAVKSRTEGWVVAGKWVGKLDEGFGMDLDELQSLVSCGCGSSEEGPMQETLTAGED